MGCAPAGPALTHEPWSKLLLLGFYRDLGKGLLRRRLHIGVLSMPHIVWLGAAAEGQAAAKRISAWLQGNPEISGHTSWTVEGRHAQSFRELLEPGSPLSSCLVDAFDSEAVPAGLRLVDSVCCRIMAVMAMLLYPKVFSASAAHTGLHAPLYTSQLDNCGKPEAGCDRTPAHMVRWPIELASHGSTGQLGVLATGTSICVFKCCSDPLLALKGCAVLHGALIVVLGQDVSRDVSRTCFKHSTS